MQFLLPVHIVAGGLAIVLGATALLVAKGGLLHRKSGLLFVYAMATMGLSGSILSLRHGFNANLLGGLTSVYFVTTALTTVRSPTAWSHRLNVAAAFLAFTLGTIMMGLGVTAMTRPHGMLNGVPWPMLAFLSTTVLLGGVGDLRIMRSRPPRGALRLRRHLWRMCFALFIAAGSFFSIRSRVATILPEPFLSGPMRALPVLLLFVAMFYWLWRVRSRVIVQRPQTT
jgi:uncharacterized membrane protein